MYQRQPGHAEGCMSCMSCHEGSVCGKSWFESKAEQMILVKCVL